LAVLSTYGLSPSLVGQDGAWGVAEYVLGSAGLMAPFAVFSGGLAFSSASKRFRALLPLATGVAIASYLCTAVATPMAEYNVDLRAGADVAAVYPFGPETPSGLARLRAAMRERPTVQYSFRLDSPLSWPPNWVTHRLHQGVSFSLFALPNALLGLLVGLLTASRPPPARRRTRWTAGLAVAVLFFGAVVLADGWVTGDPTVSGVASGWLPLIVPVVLAVGLWNLARRRGLFDKQTGLS
jgi:hypothetical protein